MLSSSLPARPPWRPRRASWPPHARPTPAITPDKDLLTSSKTVWPLFIDPSITGKTKDWTTTYKKYPTSSFYDGANYNTGTTEARVGYESTTGGLSRSFFRLAWTSSIKGATVTEADLRLYETYSWSCSAREMRVWRTGGISSSTTWNNQPSWTKEIGRKSFANGWSSSCPDAYVVYDGKSVAQDAADGGWTNFTIGLQASTEDSSYSWKKFKAEGESAPKIVITYNRKPAEPTKLDISPDTGWSLASIPLMTGTPDVTGDGIPDIWALMADGTVRFYKATATWGGSATTVISGGWENKMALG
ncbi:DNRLRE domain-containing protein [Streptomyces sp. NPDC056672]|uniref:DNRLRE domain-containing protein n=1 Tax=Streptomyces sp. NPDC056672 TaxID=3345906 RepID=UPI0036A4C445